jgi:hypothetical protein
MDMAVKLSWRLGVESRRVHAACRKWLTYDREAKTGNTHELREVSVRNTDLQKPGLPHTRYLIQHPAQLTAISKEVDSLERLDKRAPSNRVAQRGASGGGGNVCCTKHTVVCGLVDNVIESTGDLGAGHLIAPDEADSTYWPLYQAAQSVEHLIRDEQQAPPLRLDMRHAQRGFPAFEQILEIATKIAALLGIGR